jgi:Ca2+-binding RTX toxin-like protein
MDLTGDGNADLNIFWNLLRVFGGGGDDEIKLSIQPTPTSCETFVPPSMIQGGPGDDVITGTGAGTAITVVGGAGDDTIDAYECSFDQGDATPGTFGGSAGNDTIVGGARSLGTDNIRGGSGNDDLTGDVCDTPPPCGGSDNIWGNGGNDTIHASDGIHGNDVVRGKAGTDTCTADTGDTVASCETVTLNSIAPRSRSDVRQVTRGRIRVQRIGLELVMTLAG